MSQLLHQTRDQTETHVAELVNAKMIRAKIDRPKGVVVFRAPQQAMDLMEGPVLDFFFFFFFCRC